MIDRFLPLAASTIVSDCVLSIYMVMIDRFLPLAASTIVSDCVLSIYMVMIAHTRHHDILSHFTSKIAHNTTHRHLRIWPLFPVYFNAAFQHGNNATCLQKGVKIFHRNTCVLRDGNGRVRLHICDSPARRRVTTRVVI